MTYDHNNERQRADHYASQAIAAAAAHDAARLAEARDRVERARALLTRAEADLAAQTRTDARNDR